VAIVGLASWLLFRHFYGSTETTVINPVANEYRERLGALKRQADEKPNDAKARSDYAVALYATGQTESAKSEYEKASQLDPKNATTLNNLANAYRDLGDIDKAVRSYQQAIAINPKLANPYFNLANVQQYSQKNIDQAIQTYQNGLKALPNNEQLLLSLALAYQAKNDTTNAERVYRSILTINPNNFTATTNLERLTN
jgi:tetratricopeptide (TPR) repeat protein